MAVRGSDCSGKPAAKVVMRAGARTCSGKRGGTGWVGWGVAGGSPPKKTLVFRP